MEWAARAIGLFYIVAGVAALRQCYVGWRIEQMIEQLVAPSPKERAADRMLALGAALVLVSGMTLVLFSEWAAPAFLAAWLAQASYLLWARRMMPPTDPVAALGRRRTINAFAVYTAATVFALWLPTTSG